MIRNPKLSKGAITNYDPSTVTSSIELTPKTEANRNSFYCRTIEGLPSNVVDIEKKSMISEGA